jgi:hypothetical protein
VLRYTVLLLSRTGCQRSPPTTADYNRKRECIQMLTGHEVHFIRDDEMPDGHDWMLLEVGDEIHCLVRRSRICEHVLEDAWAGYRQLVSSNRHGLNADERRRLDDALHRIEQRLRAG